MSAYMCQCSIWADVDRLMDLLDPREEMRRDPLCDPTRLEAFELAFQFKPLDHWLQILSEHRDRDVACSLRPKPPDPDKVVPFPNKGISKGGSRRTPGAEQLPTPPKSSPSLSCEPRSNTYRKRSAPYNDDLAFSKGDENEVVFIGATRKRRKPAVSMSSISTEPSQTKDLYDLALEAEKIPRPLLGMNQPSLTHDKSSGHGHDTIPQRSSSKSK